MLRYPFAEKGALRIRLLFATFGPLITAIAVYANVVAGPALANQIFAGIGLVLTLFAAVGFYGRHAEKKAGRQV